PAPLTFVLREPANAVRLIVPPVSVVEPAGDQPAVGALGCPRPLPMCVVALYCLPSAGSTTTSPASYSLPTSQLPLSVLMSTRASTPRTGIVVVIPKKLRPLSW